MKQNGFTLIELLIVVAIIGILAAIAVPNFLNAQIRAKVARVYADMRSLGTAVEMYQVDHNVYPCDGQEPDCLSPWATQSWRLTTPVAYISSVPLDPWADQTPWEDKAVKHYWYTTREGYGGVRAAGRQTAVAGRKNVRLYDPPRDQFRFGFTSPGPDKCWEWDRPYYPEFSKAYVGDVLYYDSSNGIISNGDLYMFGPGNAYNPPADFM
ncbi:MAG TPA: prepilin-type N-terminal cleavage/methylation domain-containing protein [bacterium]|nr:prepilin-type N-terminal cleavage/methylation domain-containing protein [bacterium]HPP00493.1 prepilin-type N-terminal cleavage/methylation domain-containing protein [bacterium]HXK93517.1 prepilin-type N-terminal cleavage/methylation domain-containing protein [bacterium]